MCFYLLMELRLYNRDYFQNVAVESLSHGASWLIRGERNVP